jgi:UDP-N-acetylglucosamine 2-epimerase
MRYFFIWNIVFPLYLMVKSYLVLKDCCGIQEEAPSLGKPVLVIREATERLEVLKAGTMCIKRSIFTHSKR